LHLSDFKKKDLAVIWFFVIRFNPFFTRYNAPCIAKELGIQKTFDYGVVIFGK